MDGEFAGQTELREGRIFQHHTVDGADLSYEMGGGRRNPRGLTDLRKTLVTELIKFGILFDVDHMSYQTRADTLDIAEANGYPVFSGHSGYVDVCRGDKRHEGQLTATEVERIRRLGGMVSPIIAQGKLDQIATWQRPDGTSIPHVCGGSVNSYVQAYLYAVERMQGSNVGIGTDFNGFAGLPGPISGPNACPGGPSGTGVHPVGQLSYPFAALAADGASTPRSQIGQKTYDINTDGLAHVGMLPDLVSHLRAMGVSDTELDPVLSSAESFVGVWEKAARRGLPVPSRGGVSVASWAPNRLDVFAVGTDGALCHQWCRLISGTRPLLSLLDWT